MSLYKKNNSAFTLVELTLSMSFISVLLLAIAMTVIQVSNIYNKGVTLKATNQAGRQISYELQKSIAQVLPFNIVGTSGNRYIRSDWGGRLCIGQYSYIWNYGEAIVNTNTHLNAYMGSNEQINFIKVFDSNAYYCSNPGSLIDKSMSIELLKSGEHNLAMHSFDIASNDAISDPKTNQRMYNIIFTIGTNDQLALTDGSSVDTQCKAPNEEGADLVYCSVNQFNIAVLAGSSVN